jgi:hypothetical protein
VRCDVRSPPDAELPLSYGHIVAVATGDYALPLPGPPRHEDRVPVNPTVGIDPDEVGGKNEDSWLERDVGTKTRKVTTPIAVAKAGPRWSGQSGNESAPHIAEDDAGNMWNSTKAHSAYTSGVAPCEAANRESSVASDSVTSG